MSLDKELNGILLDLKDGLITVEEAKKKIMGLFYERERELTDFLELEDLDLDYLDDFEEDDEYGDF